jgi:lipopolysaccharide biosynthesis glycosyltransferase
MRSLWNHTLPIKAKVDDIVAVSAADDGYAMPLAVTIRSTLDHLAKDRRLRLFVFDGGLSAESRKRLLDSWQDVRLTVEWLTPDMQLVRDLKVSEHINVVTYLRLLMPWVLPADVGRAIYLDADMLVRRDLGKLWDEPMDGHAALAVQDVAAPWIDAYVTVPNLNKCKANLCAITPVVNYREFGIPANAKYFNGGMLVADLTAWRRQKYTERMLAVLREHRQHVLWWDQYALNAVLAGQWRGLDLRWNQGAHIYMYPNWRESPFEREIFEGLQSEPWIVHFCSPSKPWHYFCRHPFTADWCSCLRETDWHAWKPERPEQFIRAVWDYHYRPVRQEWKRNVRALKQAIRTKLRKAA